MQFSGCANRLQASSVEQICPEAHRIVRLYGQTAMNAIGPVHDGIDMTATAPAAIVSLKASAVQEDRGNLAHFPEAGGAAAREARVTCGYAGGIDEQSAHRLDSRHRPRDIGSKRLNDGPEATAPMTAALTPSWVSARLPARSDSARRLDGLLLQRRGQ
jgi:hypothetical protein